MNNKNIREVVLPESSEEDYQTIVVEMPRVKKEAVLVILHGFTGKVDDMMYCGHSDTSIIDLNSWPELKKNLANKIFGYLARCDFWLKLGLRFWIFVGYVDILAKFGAKSDFRVYR